MDIRIKIFHIINFRFNYIIGEESCLGCKCYTPWGPGLLVQDLDPNDLRLDLVVVHKPDVVAQVILAREVSNPGSIVAQPVLCINSYFHSC